MFTQFRASFKQQRFVYLLSQSEYFTSFKVQVLACVLRSTLSQLFSSSNSSFLNLTLTSILTYFLTYCYKFALISLILSHLYSTFNNVQLMSLFLLNFLLYFLHSHPHSSTLPLYSFQTFIKQLFSYLSKSTELIKQY